MRIACIGFGCRIKDIYITNIRGQCPEARMVAVLDPDQAAARARLPEDERQTTVFVDSVVALIATRPDAVLVGTRCNLHARYAIELAAYGLPIFLEKPVATSLADAIALEHALGAASDRVVVSFPLRVSTLVNQARRWLAEPQTGRISHVNAVNYVTYGWHYFDRWYRDSTITQGLILQKATHDFDYLAHLVGSPIVRVAAMSLRGRVHQDTHQRQGEGEHDVSYHEGIGTPESGMNEDCSSSLIEFANGIHGTYSQVFFARNAAGARGVTLCGQRATISFDWLTDRVRRVWHHEPREESMLLSLDPQLTHSGGDAILGQSLIDVVHHGKPSVAPLRAGLESVYACLAAMESAETGRFVQVRRWGQA